MRYIKSIGSGAAALTIAISAIPGSDPAFAVPVSQDGGQIQFGYLTSSGITS
jgi:hypothetical protein